MRQIGTIGKSYTENGMCFLSFLHIRLAARTGRDRFAHKSCKDHNSQHVGQCVHHLHRHNKGAEIDILVSQCNGLKEAKEQAGPKRMPWPPLGKDQRGQRNKSAPGRQ